MTKTIKEIFGDFSSDTILELFGGYSEKVEGFENLDRSFNLKSGKAYFLVKYVPTNQIFALEEGNLDSWNDGSLTWDEPPTLVEVKAETIEVIQYNPIGKKWRCPNSWD